jgi:hypothetical protein
MRQEPVVDPLIVGKAVHQDYRRILAGDLEDEDAALGVSTCSSFVGAMLSVALGSGMGESPYCSVRRFLVCAVRRLPGRSLRLAS